MGSTTRRHGVYAGEYAPTGLRLFAWWRKNGEMRLQKAGSGSTQIRPHLNWQVAWFFYRRTIACIRVGHLKQLACNVHAATSFFARTARKLSQRRQFRSNRSSRSCAAGPRWCTGQGPKAKGPPGLPGRRARQAPRERGSSTWPLVRASQENLAAALRLLLSLFSFFIYFI
jgi:hypothetical protein